MRELSDSSVTESNTRTTVVDSRSTNGTVKVYPGQHRKPLIGSCEIEWNLIGFVFDCNCYFISF